MATIVIRDLSDSTELDREAMLAVIGGTRSGGRPWRPDPSQPARIIDYPPGIRVGRPAAAASERGAKG